LVRSPGSADITPVIAEYGTLLAVKTKINPL